MKPVVNVTVGGQNKPTNYTYKTVVLKSNLPFAAQVTEPNCIYVIKWDFDLGGDTVTIPENCVLEFDGGSLNNGTLVGDDTVIVANLVKIFDTTISIDGTWASDCWSAEWFGAVGDDETDNGEVINSALNIIPYVHILTFGRGTFRTSTQIDCALRQIRLGYRTTIKATETMACLVVFHGVSQATSWIYRGLKIDGGEFDGDNKARIVIACYGLYEGTISNTRITGGTDCGIASKYDDGERPYDFDPRTFGFIRVCDVTGLNPYANTATFLRLGADDSASNINARDYHIGMMASDNVTADNVASWINQKPVETGHTMTYVGSVAFRIDGYCELTNCMIDTYHIGIQFVGSHRGNLSASNLSWMNTKKEDVPNAGTAYMFDAAHPVSVTDVIMIPNFFVHSSSNAFVVMTPNLKQRLDFSKSYIMSNGFNIAGNNKLDLDHLSLIKYKNYINNSNDVKYIRIGYASGVNNSFNILTLKSDRFAGCNLMISAYSTGGVKYRNARFNFLNPNVVSVYYKDVDLDTIELVVSVGGWMNAFWKSDTQSYLDDTVITDIDLSEYTKVNDIAEQDYGNTKPTISNPYAIGYRFFDTVLGKPVYWTGQRWITPDGAKADINVRGTFASKPSAIDVYVGFQYFCTDRQTPEQAAISEDLKGIVIYHKGSNVWTDALGRVVE